MYTSITLFFVSMFAILFMLVNKAREINTGQTYISFGGKVETFVNSKYSFIRKILTEFPKHFGREMAYSMVHKGMKLAHQFKVLLYPKIGHIIEAVKGKHFPKTKREASFFLGHIENFKEKEVTVGIEK